MSDDPFPRGDMPIRIGIPEKVAAVDQLQQIHSGAHPEPGRNAAKTERLLLIDGFDGYAHEERF